MFRVGRSIAVLCATFMFPSYVGATSIIYTDRTVFEGDNPGLVVEDFEGSNVLSGNAFAFPGPLNSATNNAFFSAGSVVDGFSLSAEFGDIFVGNDFGGVPTTTVSSNFFEADLLLDFAPFVTAVGLDLFGFQSVLVAEWTVDVGGTITVSSTTITTPGFFGVSTDIGMITSLMLDKPNSGGSIDNLTFGIPIPEPSGVLLFSVGMLVVGSALRRRSA